MGDFIAGVIAGCLLFSMAVETGHMNIDSYVDKGGVVVFDKQYLIENGIMEYDKDTGEIRMKESE